MIDTLTANLCTDRRSWIALVHRMAWITAGLLTPIGAVAQIVVGRNVQVSVANSTAHHYEIQANADPNNTNHLIACSYLYPSDKNDRGTVVYSSFDGGLTWRESKSPSSDTLLKDTGDPVCAFGVHGEAYFSALGRGTMLYRSDDGGLTWGESLQLAGTDRQSVIADHSQSKYRGSVYINATGNTRGLAGDGYGPDQFRSDLTVFSSRDGIHFNTSKRSELGRDYVLGMGNGAVLPDGSLIFVFGEIFNNDGMTEIPRPTRETPNAKLSAVLSSDGGQTLSAAVKISAFHMDWPPYSSAVIPYVVADLSNGPFKGRAYVVWPDRRSGRDEIYVAYSDDKGATWSRPVIVNDDREWPESAGAGPDNLLPVIGVNKDGVVGVSWQDRRDNPDNLGYWVRFTASLDGGDTWLPSKRVSEKPNTIDDEEQWPLSGGSYVDKGAVGVSVYYQAFAFSGGHYAGLAVSADGRFHPTWADNRTGPAQIWTAPITVTGAVTKHGAAELDSMTNVSDKVSVEITEPRFDRMTGTLTVTATLKNTSKDTIRGPIKGRVIDLRSELGQVTIEGATNGIKGPGAIFDFSDLLPAGILLPDAKSQSRKLSVILKDRKPLHSGNQFRTAVLSLFVRVFAAGPPPPPAK